MVSKSELSESVGGATVALTCVVAVDGASVALMCVVAVDGASVALMCVVDVGFIFNLDGIGVVRCVSCRCGRHRRCAVCWVPWSHS